MVSTEVLLLKQDTTAWQLHQSRTNEIPSSELASDGKDWLCLASHRPLRLLRLPKKNTIPWQLPVRFYLRYVSVLVIPHSSCLFSPFHLFPKLLAQEVAILRLTDTRQVVGANSGFSGRAVLRHWLADALAVAKLSGDKKHLANGLKRAEPTHTRIGENPSRLRALRELRATNCSTAAVQ